MHHTFTGSSRKTRQVNLSGRTSANPWATLSSPSSTSAAKPAAGTHDALASAQAGRLQRQRERQKLTSAQTLQRTWRGIASRRQTRQHWRDQWDLVEECRLGDRLPLLVRYEEAAEREEREPARPYKSLELCYFQLRLLVHFLDVKDRLDRMRLLYFVGTLQATVTDPTGQKDIMEIAGSSLEKIVSFSRLGQVTAECIGRGDRNPSQLGGQQIFDEKATVRCLELLKLLGELLPETLSRNAAIYFRTISDHLASRQLGDEVQTALLDLVATLLGAPDPQRQSVYRKFAFDFLGTGAPTRIPHMVDVLAQVTDQALLADVLSNEIKQSPGTSHDGGFAGLTHSPLDASTQTEAQLWRLAYFVHLHNRRDQKSRSTQSPRGNSNRIDVLANLLSSCANDVAERLQVEDESMGDHSAAHLKPLPSFVRQSIESLARQPSIAEVMSDLASVAESEPLIARQLSNYAVALLRAFPQKAPNIRMWLYQGSMRSKSKTDVSTIQYFWNAAQGAKVFNGIYQTQRNVMSLLKQPAPDHNQIGRPQPGIVEKKLWRDEWQIILLFLELYTFVLKPMDDEEFFSLQETNGARLNAGPSLYSRRGALPLADIARLTTFLKNLAFTLYWNASDLADSNSFEDAGGLSAYFGNSTPEKKRYPQSVEPQSLAGIDGVSQAYLKGLVTGLLRMLHERDSRRKFLPEKHWLMTSHVDMSGFIPAVVAEEEKRHEFGDDTLEEEEDLEEILGDGGFSRSAAIDVPQGPFSRQREASAFSSVPNAGQTRTYAEALQRKRDIARRKRQLASLAPRLEILRNLPFFIPFETRVQIFREFVKHDQLRRREGHIDPDNWRMHTATAFQRRGFLDDRQGLHTIAQHRAEVHREHIFNDAFDSFYQLGEGLKEPIQISFIDRFGNPEAGIDGGGVTKEFLTSITNEAFDPVGPMTMFSENDQHEIYPNPNMWETTHEILRQMGYPEGSPNAIEESRKLRQHYEFLGRVLGKCLYEGILVDVNFAGFFLLKWALTGGTTSASNETAYRPSINDVKDFDNDLYQGLLQLKNYPGDVEADFSLNFSVTSTMPIFDPSGEERTHTVTRDLIPNGSNTAVTNANRLVYIDQIARYRLQLQPAAVTWAFLKGLGLIIQPMWLAMFNQKELQTLVGGENSELDIADLRRNTQYNGLYQIGDDGLEHPTIVLFWKVLREMSDEDRRKVLKFVTSTPRAPLLGFSNLNPPFTIHSTSASEGAERLPSTSTCVNLLKLPNYRDEKTMREKLLYAANSGAGFDLS